MTRGIDSFGFLMKSTTDQKTLLASIKSTKTFHAVHDSDAELKSSPPGQHEPRFGSIKLHVTDPK
jgi:hypothetical protein